MLLQKSTEAVYRAVSRGLFERHKLLLPLLLCSGMLRSTGEVMVSTKTCASKEGCFATMSQGKALR